MGKNKLIIGIALLLLIVVLAFLLGRSSKDCNDSFQTILKRDTLIIVKQSEPLIIEKIKPKIIIQKDTLILTKPFVAIVDTIIKRDTVFAKYEFPQNNFNLLIRRKQDSIIVQTVYITKEIVKERPWWEASAYTLGGTVAGFLIGRTIK